MSATNTPTMGWYTVPAITGSRLGRIGPGQTTANADYTFKIILRVNGDHEGYRSYWEYDQSKVDAEWMLMVLDARRNIVGQVFRHTKKAARLAMNDVFKAKGLGTFSRHHDD
jgi:hypothetical protein